LTVLERARLKNIYFRVQLVDCEDGLLKVVLKLNASDLYVLSSPKQLSLCVLAPLVQLNDSKFDSVVYAH